MSVLNHPTALQHHICHKRNKTSILALSVVTSFTTHQLSETAKAETSKPSFHLKLTFLFLQDCERLRKFESFVSPNHQIKTRQQVVRGRVLTVPAPQCLCLINLQFQIHFQNTKESQHFHQGFTGHSKKHLFSLQKFPEAKERTTHLTQGASSSTSGNQIQPAGQIHLPHLSFVVVVPSPVCLCMSIHSVSASCCQAYRVKGEEGKGATGDHRILDTVPEKFL